VVYPIQSSWNALDDLTAAAKTTVNTVSKLITKLQEISTEGSLGNFTEQSKSVLTELKRLDDQITHSQNLIDSLDCKVIELQNEVARLCVENKLSEKIFSSGPNLIVFPLVIHFGSNDKGIEVIAGGEKIKSSRADYIYEQIRLLIAKPIDPKSFLKSLKSAYSLLLKSENQRDVSLEEIRQVLNIGPDSTNQCSKEDFGAKIQILYGLYGDSIDPNLPKFTPVAAAARSYLLIGRDGTSITVGSVSFGSSKET
jgi:hypothetical protein